MGSSFIDQIHMPDRPAGGCAHLAHRSPHGITDRLSLVGSRRGIAQQLESGGIGIDALEHTVVLLGDLANLGMRFHRYGSGVVVRLALLVHVGEQVEDLCAGAVLGNVEANPLALGIHSKGEPTVDQPKQQEAEPEGPKESSDNSSQLHPKLRQTAPAPQASGLPNSATASVPQIPAPR